VNTRKAIDARIPLLGLGLFLVACLSPSRQAQGAGDGFQQGLCGQTVTGNVVLTRDLSDCKGDGIVIAADDVVVDCGGHVISGTGSGDGIRAIDHSRLTVKNCVIRDFDKGVHLKSSHWGYAERTSSDNKITRNTLAGNQHAIFLLCSHHARISDNRILSNLDSGITLAASEHRQGNCPNHTTISGNTIASNRRGLVTWCPYFPQVGNTCTENTFANNIVAVTDWFQKEDRIRYESNAFRDNLNTVFFAFDGDHLLTSGAPRPFAVSIYRSDGTPCTDFEITGIGTSPEEEVSFSREGNAILGSFTPRRRGLYSMNLAVRGCGQRSIEQRYWFGREKSATLHLDLGRRNDVGTLVAAPPARPVRVYCTMWIQAQVEEPPEETGIVKITRVRASMRSNYIDHPSHKVSNVYGLEFDGSFSRRGDVFVSVAGKYPRGLCRVTEELHKGLFLHDPAEWKDIAVKYWGLESDWIGTPDEPATVTFHYLVTDSPVVTTLSNPKVRILSATTPVESGAAAEIVLKGNGPTALAVEMGDPDQMCAVDLDGVPCDRSSACDWSQSGGAVRLDLTLKSEHTVSIGCRKEDPQSVRDPSR